jgi:hypothetical protein
MVRRFRFTDSPNSYTLQLILRQTDIEDEELEKLIALEVGQTLKLEDELEIMRIE